MAIASAMTSTEELPTTIALLGATGNTGKVVLRGLLGKAQHKIKIYARSQEKLLQMFPTITSNPNVQLFIGSITDEGLMQKLLAGAQTIICTLGNDGLAPSNVLRQSAREIMTALQDLKNNSPATEWRKPRLIWLSSSTKNERFAAARPYPVHRLIESAFSYGYTDLQVAINIINDNPELVSPLYVQPGVLIEEPGTGYEISVDSVRVAASYEDLGKAFVELASNQSYSGLREVGVSSKQGDRIGRYAPTIAFRMVRGLFVVHFPFGVRINQAMERLALWLKRWRR